MADASQHTRFSHGFDVSLPRLIERLGPCQPQAGSSVPGSFYIYDLVEQRTLCSSYSVATLLGYTPDEIDAMGHLGLASLMHPDDIQPVSEYFQHLTTLSDQDVLTVEYRMKHADGTWHWLRSQDTLLTQASNGLPMQVLGLVQDVTVPKQDHASLDSASLDSLTCCLTQSLSDLLIFTHRQEAIAALSRAFEQATHESPSDPVTSPNRATHPTT